MADESIVYTWLVNGSPSAVSALVGQRVYPTQAPQDVVRPFIVYRLVAAVPQNQLSGTPGIDNRRVQIDCYAESYAAVKEILSAVRDELEWADRCHCKNENPVDFEPDTRLFRASADFSLWLHR